MKEISSDELIRGAYEWVQEALGPNALKRAARALNAGMLAKHVKPKHERCLVETDPETGERIIINEGGWTYSKQLKDHPTRIRAAAEVMRLLGAYPPEKREVTAMIEPIQMTEEERKIYQETAQKLARVVIKEEIEKSRKRGKK